MTPRIFTPQEHARLSAAVRAAESRTSGEIVCVVARQSGDYFFPAATLLLSLVLVGGVLLALALDHFWLALRLPLFAAAELLAGLSLLLLLKISPALRLALTPRRLRARAVYAAALAQFIARNVHVTEARTGVLIFVSLAERRAELLADSGIHARVPEGTWDALVAGIVAGARENRLADALVEAVDEAGRHLAQHFPPTSANPNEIADHVIEL